MNISNVNRNKYHIIKNIVIVISYLFFFILSNSIAEEINVLKLKIKSKNEKINYIQFDFTKKNTIKITGDTTFIKGTASFLKPNFYKIITFSPVYQEFISDGEQRYFYSKKNKQVIITKNKNLAGIHDFNNLISDFLEKYDWKKIVEQENTFEITLLNEKKAETCLFIISKLNLQIIELDIDTADLKTVYSFTNVKESEAFDKNKNLFSFKKQKNIEVIQE